MAVTQNSYTQQNNSTVAYPFTVPYLKASDIKVSLDAVATTAFSLSNATTVQLNSVPPVGTKIKIFRETGIDSLSATFYAGSAKNQKILTTTLHKTYTLHRKLMVVISVLSAVL